MGSSWLDEMPADRTAMAEVNAVIKRFRAKQKKMIEAETVFLALKSEFDDYCKEVASVLRRNGIESLKCEDGAEVSVEQQVKASLKKDLQSKRQVAEWLESNGLGNLVTRQYILTATPAAKSLLEANNIAYDDEVGMNTNQVKAYVKGELNKGNMTEADIPAGLSWYSYDAVTVK